MIIIRSSNLIITLCQGSMRFIIDTGAEKTQINEIEAERIGLEFSSLDQSPKPVGTVAGLISAKQLNDVILIFKTHTGSTTELALDNLLVTSRPKGRGKHVLRQIPNLLGRDLLIKYKVRLVADFGITESYMELKK